MECWCNMPPLFNCLLVTISCREANWCVSRQQRAMWRPCLGWLAALRSMPALSAQLWASCKTRGSLTITSRIIRTGIGICLVFSGMSHLRSPSQKMRRVTRGFQEKEIFGEPSWGPHPPNTTSQSEITLTVIFVWCISINCCNFDY